MFTLIMKGIIGFVHIGIPFMFEEWVNGDRSVTQEPTDIMLCSQGFPMPTRGFRTKAPERTVLKAPTQQLLPDPAAMSKQTHPSGVYFSSYWYKST